MENEDVKDRNSELLEQIENALDEIGNNDIKNNLKFRDNLKKFAELEEELNSILREENLL